MICDVLDFLFGCWHRNYSFPITARSGKKSPAAVLTGTYVVCLDCGKEFPYDWQQMKVVTAEPAVTRSVIGPAPKPLAPVVEWETHKAA